MFDQWINPGARLWEIARNDPFYVDKTGMLSYLNQMINRPYRYAVVTRPRRFGKTTDKDMIAAYYDNTVDGSETFKGLKIEKDPDFDRYRNHFHVLSINPLNMLSGGTPLNGIYQMTVRILEELAAAFPDANIHPRLEWDAYWNAAQQHIQMRKRKGSSQELEPTSCSIALEKALTAVANLDGTPFVILIDEWDAFFRKFPHMGEENEFYLDFLRDILKDKGYIALVYMTGIFPVRKYGEHSALNMFQEFSMIEPGGLAPYMGFTEKQVRTLCGNSEKVYQMLRDWYDGYLMELPAENLEGMESLRQIHIYSPYSVAQAVREKKIKNYWNQSETFKALQDAVKLPFGGLKYIVSGMMRGERHPINPRTYQNDISSFKSTDDVLTMLVHLGYLAYDARTGEVFIPNRELMAEFESAVKDLRDYGAVLEMIQNSERLLRAIWAEDAETTSALIQAAMDTVDEQAYYNEQVLVMAIRSALIAGNEYYLFLTEVPAGRGRADLIGIPLPGHPEVPALLIEAKIDQNAKSAIEQIRRKQYPEKLKPYAGNLMIVGANYDKKVRSAETEYKKWTDVMIERD